MKLALIAVLAMTTPGLVLAQASHRSSYGSAYTSSSYNQPSRSAYSSSYSQPVHVNGYTKTDGTYVQPHYRTQADDTRTNNYSTQGNVNPYTGTEGTRDPYGD